MAGRITKDLQGDGVVAEQHRAQAIAMPHEGMRQIPDETDLGTQLPRQPRSGLPELQAGAVRPQQIRQELGIALVRAGSALPEAPPTTLDDLRRDDVDPAVVLTPQEINPEVVGRFQSNEALGGWDAQALTGSLELGESLAGVGNDETGQGYTGFIEKDAIMFLFAPINPKLDRHWRLLA